MRIGIVAAEPSGDLLAAGLMAALRDQLPDVEFEGVAGPMMRDVGIDEWASMDTLSVMGLFEVLRHLPRLLRLRAALLARWRESPPALFIGVVMRLLWRAQWLGGLDPVGREYARFCRKLERAGIIRGYVGASPAQVDALIYDIEAALDGRELGPVVVPEDPDVATPEDREKQPEIAG